MILGNICTRQCRFCAVQKGVPEPLDLSEPERVAEMAQALSLKHVVVTSVTRDDLPDGGAGIFAETIKKLRLLPGVTIEVLTSDFMGNEGSVAAVLKAAPDVFNHNLGTVRRLQAAVRPQAGYDRSIGVLKMASSRSRGIAVKSGMMLGMGETDAEITESMADLLAAGCRVLTLGQYLPPSRSHWPVSRFVTPGQFDAFREKALAMGFAAVAAGPLVRSSYNAAGLMAEAVRAHTENALDQARPPVDNASGVAAARRLEDCPLEPDS